MILSIALSITLLYTLPEFIGSINAVMFGFQEFPVPAWMRDLLQLFFSIYIFGSLFPFFFFTGLSLLPDRGKKASTEFPFVSVIIPSFNEEANISECIESVLRFDYPSYEVIVVDDGSRDRTQPLIENYDVSYIRLRNNRGKVAALNKGIEKAKGEIIFITDSDTLLDPMALRYLVAGFSDPSIAAVAGKVLLKRNDTYLKRMQTIEYLYGQEVIKEAQAKSGESVSICPGPVTAFRRSALFDVGGFKNRTLAEDFDMTLDLQKTGYKALYEPRAIAYTTAMTSWKNLKKQRIRWSRGHLQVYRQYHDTMFSGAIGSISMFWLPYSLFIGYGSAFLEIVFLTIYPVVIFVSPNPVIFLKLGLAYLLIMETIAALQGIIPLVQSRQATLFLVLSAFMTQPYRLFLSYARLEAFAYELKSKKNVW
jgi:cellulose synthase/poly-beta-1,6-N-acetylglucosamine synthase-like glycosyltransferase